MSFLLATSLRGIWIVWSASRVFSKMGCWGGLLPQWINRSIIWITHDTNSGVVIMLCHLAWTLKVWCTTVLPANVHATHIQVRRGWKTWWLHLGSRGKTYSSPCSTGMGCQLCPPGSCKQANFCLLTALMVAIPAVNGNQKKSCRERNRQWQSVAFLTTCLNQGTN